MGSYGYNMLWAALGLIHLNFLILYVFALGKGLRSLARFFGGGREAVDRKKRLADEIG